MELMREAGVIDAETEQPVTGSVAVTDHQGAFQQLLHSTDDLAALDKLDEVLAICLKKTILRFAGCRRVRSSDLKFREFFGVKYFMKYFVKYF